MIEQREVLVGDGIRLRSGRKDDVAPLVAIRSTPEVHRWWRGDDLEADVREALQTEGLHVLVVEDDTGAVIGEVQWEVEDDPEYRHASIDLFLDPRVHGRGLGPEVVRTLCRHLIDAEGLHRFTIDPAAANTAAIRCYEKVGFRPVGVLRRYERGTDGTWHDGLLMDLLADELR
jgi:aminoglycoside 6'-N-acetyltransferase